VPHIPKNIGDGANQKTPSEKLTIKLWVNLIVANN